MEVCIHQPYSRHFSNFKSNTTSDWLKQIVQPIKGCLTFKFGELGKESYYKK